MAFKLVDVTERAIWTAFQSLAGAIVAANTVGILGFDWKAALVAAGSAALLSIAKTLGVGATQAAQPQPLELVQPYPVYPEVTDNTRVDPVDPSEESVSA